MARTQKPTTFSSKIIFHSQYLGAHIFRIYLRLSGGYTVNNMVTFSKDKTYFFIANHQSRIDPFVTFASLPQKTVSSVLPIRFMTARGIYYSVLYLLLKILGCFPTRKKGVDVISRSNEYLNSGYCMYIFPEGRRVLQTESNPRAGVERILASIDPQIQPVLVHIEWTKGSRFNRHLSVSLKEVNLVEISELSAGDIMQLVYKI
ncbi:MAG: lysophospholipid acyltransferase family protein [Candidatus Saccharimonadales bacterium]